MRRSSYYSLGETQTGIHIDMRREFDAIIHGDGITPAQGHWILYRRFDLKKKSQYWDQEYRESKGGPSWEYTEEMIRVRHTQITAGSLTRFFEMELPPGIIHVDYRIYYLPWTSKPKKEDEIYEIDWEDHSKKPTVAEVKNVIERYNINDIVPLRGDNGRIEFYACLSRVDNVKS